MATKTEKKKSENFKRQKKADEERMKNLSPNDIAQLENYAVYQILYINDAACNECEFLLTELKKVQYRTNGVRKIYDNLMKRVNAYRELIYSTQIDKNSLANLFSNMDDYLDSPIHHLRQAIEDVLKEHGAKECEWVAAVETAYSVCNFAEHAALDLIRYTSKYSKNVWKLKPIVITPIKEVVLSLCQAVAEIHVGSNNDIDLNQEPKAMSAYRKLYKVFTNPNAFLNAVNNADTENANEGNMTLMYDNQKSINN